MSTYGGYVDWRYFPGPWQTDGLPNDPAADSMEAMQERDARELAADGVSPENFRNPVAGTWWYQEMHAGR